MTPADNDLIHLFIEQAVDKASRTLMGIAVTPAAVESVRKLVQAHMDEQKVNCEVTAWVSDNDPTIVQISWRERLVDIKIGFELP